MPVKTKVFCAVGRRKASVARIRLSSGDGTFTINGREPHEYFPLRNHQNEIFVAQTLVKSEKKVNIRVRVTGGGLTGQAGACRLGIARALQLHTPATRPKLKKASYLKRDSP